MSPASLGADIGRQGNPTSCVDPYAPSFWLGRPGALTQIKMSKAGIERQLDDKFAVHDLLDGQSIDRSPYGCRTWVLSYEWLKAVDMSTLMEYATRQRGFGPFIFVDPQMKNLLTPNQASGTDALHTTEGFSVTGTGDALSSSNVWSAQGERSLLWQQIVPLTPQQTQVYDTFDRNSASTWNTSTSGHTWTNTGGSASDYNVTTAASTGTHLASSINVMRTTSIPSNVNTLMTADFAFGSPTPSGAAYTTWIQSRYTDQNNFYAVRYNLSTTGVLTYWFEKRVTSTFTVLSPVITGAIGYTTGTMWRTEIYAQGSTLKARVYPVTSPRPAAWTFEITDASLTTGANNAVSTRVESGGFGAPTTSFDNVTINWAKGGVLTLPPPTGLYGFCLPPGATYAFSGIVRGYGGQDISVDVTPRVQLLNSVGVQTGLVNGATITTVTGSSSSFCVTGTVPSGTTPYVLPGLSVSDASVTDQGGLFIDQLQFELTPTGGCTTWEYGQGQPFVGVRAERETVPRILRTTVNFTIMEVT
jgi:hypothetical protein